MERRGFTLVELLIFAAIFSVIMVGFVTMLIVVLRVQGQQSSADEVGTQGQFLLQQLEYYVQSARLVSMTQDVATGTLQLRMTTSTLDPTVVSLASGTVYIQQGLGGELQALTSNKVVVSNLSFTRHYNLNSPSTPYGTDSVSYSFTVAANTSNTTQQYSQAFQSAAALLSPVAKIALIQQNSAIAYGTSTNLAATFNSNNATGSLLVAVVANNNVVNVTVSSDTAGNAWTQVASETYPAYGAELSVFAALNAKNSSDTVTVGFSGSGAFNPSFFLYEYRGAATSSSFDARAVAALTASTTLSSGSASPTSAVELVLSALMAIPTSTNTGAVYQYARAITVTSTLSVASGTNTSFPMLVSSTLATWEASSTGGGAGHIQHLCTAPGGSQEPCDLVFATSTANCGTTDLSFETESYTSSTGALIDWVNVPTLAAGSTIYACYDNTAITTDQSSPSSTWNSNYAAVWHLFAPTGTLATYDSTANANNGTNNGATATTTAEIGGAAAAMNGTSNFIHAAKNITLNAPLSVSAWVYVTGNTGGYNAIISNRAASGSLFFSLRSMALYEYGAGTTLSTITTVSSTKWYYITLTASSSYISAYINGVFNSGTSTPSFTGGSQILNIGQDESSSYFTGAMDEVRIANAVLSPSWILTEYNNQSSPATFYTVGNETALSAPPPTNAVTAGSGFTIESSSSVSDAFMEDQNLFITGPVAGTWTTSPAATSTVIVVTFK
jgi:competence protein ComGC